MEKFSFAELIFENDPFPNQIGIEILEVKPGYAKGQLRLTDMHRNVIGAVHGGAIFSLGDTVCGNASASYDIPMTTIDARINFLRPALNEDILYAEAREIKHGRSVCFYEVSVTGGSGKLIATGQYSFFALNGKEEILPDKPESES